MNFTTAVIAVVVIGLGVIGYLEVTNKGEVAVNTKTVIEEVHPEWATDEEAVAAAQAVIDKKAWVAELEESQATFASSTEAYEAEEALFIENKERLEKLIGSYWRDQRNIKAYIRKIFYEEPNTAVAVAMAESGLRMIQSNHRYPKDMAGHTAGTREQSFCIFQIHSPAHHQTAVRLGYENYRTEVEDCVNMARVIYDQAGGWSPWTVYNKNMHLAYVR